MRYPLFFLFHFLACFIKLLRPGGIKSIAAENLVLRQQLIIMNRTRKRSPRLTLAIEMKARNPCFGYGRIAMQIFEAFGVEITRFAVGRILRKNKHKLLPGSGPSWLTFIGHMKDSLWSVDLLRCESITLKSHWIMVVLDQFQAYYINVRAHSSLNRKTPAAMAFGEESNEKVASIDRYRWNKHCNGLYELPVAA